MVDEAEQEKDEGLIGADGGQSREVFEGSVFEGAAVMDGVGLGVRLEGGLNVFLEVAWFPDGGGREESGENTAAAGRQCPDGGGFFSGVAEELFGNGLFNLKYGADGFDGDMVACGVGKEQGRVEVVEDGEVDLLGALASGVDDEGGGGGEALGEIAGEEVAPKLFGGVARSGGVFEGAADGEVGKEALLNSAEDLGEVELSGVRVAAHRSS